MRVAIFGLGYVGTVSAACFAQLGHDVVGVDVSETKVAEIQAGGSPIAEAGLADLVSSGVASGRLTATTDAGQAMAMADISLVCVGTPSRPNGSLETGYVETVVGQLGAMLAARPAGSRHTVVVRSTLLPGTTLGTLRPLLEDAFGAEVGDVLGLAYNPEFLREGSAIADFWSPPYTVVGGLDEPSVAAVAELYDGVEAGFHTVSISEAEMIKYAANAFHAVKITFANEIGHASKSFGVDSHVVMDLITRDTKLNVSPAYLRPGFAFGGSCLPKDVRALLHAAQRSDVDLPMLSGTLRSNAVQVQEAVDLVLAQGSRNIGILGLSFKEGTDDLRESPMVELVETLIGKGCKLTIYDENVNWARLMGANRRFIEEAIPHIADLMVTSMDAVVEAADVLVVGNAGRGFDRVAGEADRILIDLVRLPGTTTSSATDRYHGICW